MSDLPDITQARESIRNLTRDQVTKLLLRNSELTAAQLETLLADSMAAEVDLKKTRRRFYRPTGRRISRGSYNRTLIQAQNNVIRSIYTILLLGYLGLFDSSSLQPFIELADTIGGYASDAKTDVSAHHSRAHLEEKLHEFISALAARRSFKDTL